MSTEPRRCAKCQRTMKPRYDSAMVAETIHGGRGLCSGDYSAWQRGQREQAAQVDVIDATSALGGFLAARRRRGVPATGLAVA